MSANTATIRAVIDLNSKPLIALTYDSIELREQALELARELTLPLLTSPADGRFELLLVLTHQHLELREQSLKAPGLVYADFISGALAYRRRFGGGRGQLLARAVGLKRGVNPVVLDATAGLGRDAFVLACLGCKVCLVERSPIIAALLRHGLERASQDPEIGLLVRERLRLQVADSREFMAQLPQAEWPDVIYLDPMYPHRTKAALVKKEMRLLRRIVGEDQDSASLLIIALSCARRRVVVKRPSYAPVLPGPAPALQLASKTTRFDVYLL